MKGEVTKASELRKDRADTIRVSKMVKAKLTAMGWSIQKLFNWAVDEVVKVDVAEGKEGKLDVPKKD